MWIFKGTYYLLVMMRLFCFSCSQTQWLQQIKSSVYCEISQVIKKARLWNEPIWAQWIRLFSQWRCECIWRCAAVLRWQYYRHITAASHWLDQVSAAQDVVRQFILRLIHFLLNCSPNLRCNLSCPCESFCFASLEKMRLCFHVVFFLTVPNISWKKIIFVCSNKIFLRKNDQRQQQISGVACSY